MPSSLQRQTQASPLSLPAIRVARHHTPGELAGGSPREETLLRAILVSKVRPEKAPAGPERGAGNHGSIESGRLALPDVLPARTRHRLGGMFLCHRFLADGTILTPHTAPAFSSTNRLRTGWNVKLIDHGVEFFQLLHCCEKLERFSISGYRPG